MKGEAVMVALRLRYVIEDRDRHGNVRLYVRKPGSKKVRLRSAPGTAAFAAEYEAALATGPAKPALPSRTVLRGVCARYYASPTFLALDPSTQSWRRRALDRLCVKDGDKPVALLEPRHIRNRRDKLASTPAAANHMIKALNALFAWAVDEDLATRNPARDVKPLRYVTKGHHSWTDDEIGQYHKRHPTGTKAWLALALILYSGGRREDATRLGPQHLRRGRLRFTQAKNEHRNPIHVDVPAHPELVAAIAACPSSHLTFLVTAYGRPFSVAGFGNKMRQWCDEAGLPECTAHGLRKAIAARLAEAGASTHEIAAWTGHQSLEEVEVYTKAASRKRMADGGFRKIGGEL